MSDLVEFLAARIAEDEQLARAAIADDCGQDGGFEDATWLDDPDHPRYGRIATDAANLIRATAVPRRVLAEVEAKREVIRLYGETLEFIAMMQRHGQEAPAHEAAAESYLNVIRAHAAVYARHPDYREERRP